MSLWTEEEIALCKRLYVSEGKSAAETAKALRGRTRNGVIGLAHRQGWPSKHRAKPQAPTIVRPPRAPAVQHPSPPKQMRFTAPEPKDSRTACVFGATPRATNPAEVAAAREKFAAEGGAVIATFAAPANDEAPLLIGRPFGSCAWPVGTPARPADQLCCGQRVSDGSPYCPEHRAKATSGQTLSASQFARQLRRFI